MTFRDTTFFRLNGKNSRPFYASHLFRYIRKFYNGATRKTRLMLRMTSTSLNSPTMRPTCSCRPYRCCLPKWSCFISNGILNITEITMAAASCTCQHHLNFAIQCPDNVHPRNFSTCRSGQPFYPRKFSVFQAVFTGQVIFMIEILKIQFHDGRSAGKSFGRSAFVLSTASSPLLSFCISTPVLNSTKSWKSCKELLVISLTSSSDFMFFPADGWQSSQYPRVNAWIQGTYIT